MPDTTRTFLAIELPSAAKRALGQLRYRLEPDTPGARWVDLEKAHLTLAFLGDVGNSELDDLGQSAAEIATRCTALTVHLHGLGAFPNPRKPRVLWVGCAGAGLEPLLSLRAALADAMRSIGHEPDREFSPHVTLARFASRRQATPDLTTLLKREQASGIEPFPVAEVVVFGSTLSNTGAQHFPRARCALGA
jgi:2'-5' RNA ligase